MTAENLLARARDLQPSCFAPTNIFALIEMHPYPLRVSNAKLIYWQNYP